MDSAGRRLTDGHVELRRRAVQTFTERLEDSPTDVRRLRVIWEQLERLIVLDEDPQVCVVGCGPRPHTMKLLREWGACVTGIDPIPGFVRLAGEYLGDDSLVMEGVAEKMALPDDSQDVVFFESVLEHVESPRASFAEIFRVLKPGGVAYVTTTNRYRWSWRGRNGEYNVRFYNWFPRMLQESYVFTHLHYRPTLAAYSLRPAVHWFTFARLCELGREAGFAQFYSPLDLRVQEDYRDRGGLRASLLGRGPILGWLQRIPLLRTLVLTQIGGEIFMWKRPEQNRDAR